MSQQDLLDDLLSSTSFLRNQESDNPTKSPLTKWWPQAKGIQDSGMIQVTISPKIEEMESNQIYHCFIEKKPAQSSHDSIEVILAPLQNQNEAPEGFILYSDTPPRASDLLLIFHGILKSMFQLEDLPINYFSEWTPSQISAAHRNSVHFRLSASTLECLTTPKKSSLVVQKLQKAYSDVVSFRVSPSIFEIKAHYLK